MVEATAGSVRIDDAVRTERARAVTGFDAYCAAEVVEGVVGVEVRVDAGRSCRSCGFCWNSACWRARAVAGVVEGVEAVAEGRPLQPILPHSS